MQPCSAPALRATASSLPRPRHALCASPASVLFRNGRPTCAAGSNAPAAMPPRRTRRLPPQNGPGCFPPAIPGHAALWPHPARPRWPWDAAHRRAWKIPAGTARPRPRGPAGTGTGSRRRAQAPGTCCRAGASQRPQTKGLGKQERQRTAQPAKARPRSSAGGKTCQKRAQHQKRRRKEQAVARVVHHAEQRVIALFQRGQLFCKAIPAVSQKPRQIQRAAHARRRAGAQEAQQPAHHQHSQQRGGQVPQVIKRAIQHSVPHKLPQHVFHREIPPHTASRAGTARCRLHTERPSFFQKAAHAGRKRPGPQAGAHKLPQQKKSGCREKNGTASPRQRFQRKIRRCGKRRQRAVWMHTTSSAAATRKRSTAGYPLPRRHTVPHTVTTRPPQLSADACHTGPAARRTARPPAPAAHERCQSRVPRPPRAAAVRACMPPRLRCILPASRRAVPSARRGASQHSEKCHGSWPMPVTACARLWDTVR